MNYKYTIMLLFFFNNAFSQENKATTILNEINDITKKYKNIKIDFEFILENESQEISETKSGVFYIGGSNFKIDMSELLIINNGEFQWIYLKELNEVQIINHDPEDDAMNPIKILNIYKEDYKHNYIDFESKKSEFHIIDLIPKSSNEFIKIRLKIIKNAKQIEELIMYDKQGTTYTYRIISISNNQESTRYFFDVNDYKNIEIIDLR